MAGFKNNKRPSKNFENELDSAMKDEDLQEEEEFDYYDEDDEDVIMEYKPRQEKKKEEKASSDKGNSKAKSKPKGKGSTSNNTKMLGIGLIAGLLIIVILVCVTLFGGKDGEEEKPGVNGQSSQSSEEMVSADGEDNESKPSVDGSSSSNPMISGNSNTTNNNTSNAGVSMEDSGDSINPGLPDPEKGKQNVNNGTIEDTNGFLIDINGNQIPENYTVKKIVNETDFVSYVKKRGLTADGIELLWLDAEYKGNPYTVQVPFKIWKELDSQGITVVDMEVLYLDNDAKVISYMKVKENYKEIMEKGEAALDK